MTSESTIKKTDRLLERLREPFSPDQIFWRVVEIAPDGSGLVHAYAKKHSYHDRLNKLFTTSGWSSVFNANIIPMQRIKANQVINTGKVYLTCALTIEGLGTHTSLGEAWAEEENAITTAEVQAFKRTCVQFGLGRYLDLINANARWVAVDHRKQPVVRPELPSWALPKSLRGTVKAQPTIIPTQPKQSTNPSTTGVQKAEMTVQAEPTVEEQLTRSKEDLGDSLFNSIGEHVSDYFEQKKYGGDRDKKTLECCSRAQEVIQKLRASSERVGESRFGAILDEYNVPTLNAFASIDQLVRVADAFEEIAA
jgi:hypothetical protein